MYLQTNSFPSKLSWAILASKDTVDSEKQSNTVDKKNIVPTRIQTQDLKGHDGITDL